MYMHADVKIGDVTMDEVEVCDGLRQGYILTPSLFNIYFNKIVGSWRERCSNAGPVELYNFRRKLVGDRKAKNHLN